MRRGLAGMAAAGIIAGLILIAPGGASTARGADAPTTLIYPPFGHCLGLHRATKLHLFIYLGTRTSFDEPAGLAAVKLDALDDPTTTADDDELTVFGLNSGACEVIYNTSLTNVEIYGECGDGPGRFRRPLGIAADSRGNVFVADTGNHRVVRLLYEDGALRHVRSFGSEGSGELQFRSPSGIALGESGTLYVCDTGNDRVAVLSGTGEWLGELRGEPASGLGLDGPLSVAVVEADDPWISRRRDFIVVTDRAGERLVQLSRDGAVTASVDAASLLEPATFSGVAIDYYGSTYVTDREHSRIHKFDWKLDHVTSFGQHGTGHMELDEPRGITLWRRFGQIFVTERAGAQYFWIGTDILGLKADPPELVPGEGELRLTYFLTETSRVTVELLNARGEVVHTLVGNRRRALGENVERWDGKSGRGGAPLPPGAYRLRVSARPTYSSGEYFQDVAETPVVLQGQVRP